MSFATTWMNLEDIGDYTKWNKPDRERNSPWYHLYVELENINLKVEFILIIVGNTILYNWNFLKEWNSNILTLRK